MESLTLRENTVRTERRTEELKSKIRDQNQNGVMDREAEVRGVGSRQKGKRQNTPEFRNFVTESLLHCLAINRLIKLRSIANRNHVAFCRLYDSNGERKFCAYNFNPKIEDWSKFVEVLVCWLQMAPPIAGKYLTREVRCYIIDKGYNNFRLSVTACLSVPGSEIGVMVSRNIKCWYKNIRRRSGWVYFISSYQEIRSN